MSQRSDIYELKEISDRSKYNYHSEDEISSTDSEKDWQLVGGKDKSSEEKMSSPKSSELIYLQEIFPTIDFKIISMCFEKNGHRIDICVNELLSYDFEPPPLQTPPLQTQPSVIEKKEIERPSIIIPTLSFRSENGSTPAKVKKLPPDFLLPPKFRVVMTFQSNDLVEYTAYFHRASTSLDINIRHVGDYFMVNELYRDNENSLPGIAEQAGVQVGDILYGTNFKYFDKEATLKDVTTVISCAGPYLSLQFKRIIICKTPIQVNLAKNTRRVSTQVTKYHKCTILLLEQEVIELKDVDFLNDAFLRVKLRAISWKSGFVTLKSKIGDIELALSNSADVNGSDIGAATKTINPNDASFWMRAERNMNSAGVIASSIVNDQSVILKKIIRNWFTDMTMSTLNLQPAICIRIVGAVQKSDHIEYVIWVSDVLNGIDWYTRRRYSEFYSFREQLNSIWTIFGKFDFPKRRLSVSAESVIQTTSERIPVLNTFLKKVYSFLVVEPLVHPKTRSLYILLQNFLDLTHRTKNIQLLETLSPKSQNEDDDDDELIFIHNNEAEMKTRIDESQRLLESYIQTVLQITTFQMAINSFIKRYMNLVLHESDPHNPKTTAEESCRIMSEFMENLKHILVEGFSEDCIEIYEKCSNFLNISNVDSDGKVESAEAHDIVEKLMNNAVRRQVEIEAYLPCKDIFSEVFTTAYEYENSKLAEKCNFLANMPQSFFGIPLEYISPSSWLDVISIMQTIPDKLIPCDKIQTLLRAAGEIPKQYYRERPNADRSLGADDILPIFIYCLVMSKIKNLHSLSKEFDLLCDSHSRVSEIGYYVATLEASLQYIIEIDQVNGLTFSK